MINVQDNKSTRVQEYIITMVLKYNSTRIQKLKDIQEYKSTRVQMYRVPEEEKSILVK